MKFTLTIELGNIEMHTFDHVARALKDVAFQIAEDEPIEGSDPYNRYGGIFDINGNRVGGWEAK